MLDLPPEILKGIGGYLVQAELAKLCCVSKRANLAFTSQLYENIIVTFFKDDLSNLYRPRPLPHGRNLEHTSSVTITTPKMSEKRITNCPHKGGTAYDKSATQISDWVYASIYGDQLALYVLHERIRRMLKDVDVQRLKSFHWDLPICPPLWLLSVKGFLADKFADLRSRGFGPDKAPSLTSLSLLTDPECTYFEEELEKTRHHGRNRNKGQKEEGCLQGQGVGLYWLTTLSLIGFDPSKVTSLGRQWLYENAQHLKNLTLGCHGWGDVFRTSDIQKDVILSDRLLRRGDDEDHGQVDEDHGQVDEYHGHVDEDQGQVKLTSLQSLTLYEACFWQHTAFTADALNLNKLSTLKLIGCHATATLLEVLSRNDSAGMRYLEIDYDSHGSEDYDDPRELLDDFRQQLNAYLLTMPNVESLFLCVNNINRLELPSTFLTTLPHALHRLVLQGRVVTVFEYSEDISFDWSCLVDHSVVRSRLECLGLSYGRYVQDSMLTSLGCMPNLKLLHLRLLRSDARIHAADIKHGFESGEDMDCDELSELLTVRALAKKEGVYDGPISRVPLNVLKIAQRVFTSPHFPQLRVLAWGDFYRGRRFEEHIGAEGDPETDPPHTLLLCRQERASRATDLDWQPTKLAFRPWSEANMWDRALVDANADFLEACPTDGMASNPHSLRKYLDSRL